MTLGVLACEHTQPFPPEDNGGAGPRFPASITQLTYSSGQDVIPEWLPDGSAFVYTAERRDRVDRDRCLAFMPDGGGTISRYVCPTVAPDDSIHVLDEAAIVGDSIAYVRASTERFLQGIGPDRQALVVAPLADPTAARLLQQIPFTTPWGRTYDGVSYIGWLGPSRLVLIGDSVRYPRACSNCPADTVRTGIEIFTLDFSSGGTQLSLVPGTSGASSVSRGASGDTIYFTIAGDSRVHRLALSSGQEDFPYDFGSGRPVRDARVGNGVLVAVVDGLMEDGGDLHVVALANGGDSVIRVPLGEPPLWFQRPSLSPDARKIVVQGRGLVITPIFDPVTGMVIGADTTGAPGLDVWLVTVP